MMYGLSLVPAPQAKSFAVVQSQGSPASPKHSSSETSDERLEELFATFLLLELNLALWGPLKEIESSSEDAGEDWVHAQNAVTTLKIPNKPNRIKTSLSQIYTDFL